MRELPDCPLPTADDRAHEGLHAWLMDLCGLAAIALFVASAILWCGGLAS